MITVLFSVPVAIIPQIRTLSPFWTRRRVEMFPNVPRVTGVAVAIGVAVGLVVAVTVGVAVAVAVAVEVGVGVGV